MPSVRTDAVLPVFLNAQNAAAQMLVRKQHTTVSSPENLTVLFETRATNSPILESRSLSWETGSTLCSRGQDRPLAIFPCKRRVYDLGYARVRARWNNCQALWRRSEELRRVILAFSVLPILRSLSTGFSSAKEGLMQKSVGRKRVGVAWQGHPPFLQSATRPTNTC
jgi:hypothetical protein